MANSTGLKWLETLLKELQAGGNQMLLAGVEPPMMEFFKKTGFDKLIGEDNIFPAKPGLAASAEAAIEEAQERISERSE